MADVKTKKVWTRIVENFWQDEHPSDFKIWQWKVKKTSGKVLKVKPYLVDCGCFSHPCGCITINDPSQLPLKKAEGFIREVCVAKELNFRMEKGVWPKLKQLAVKEIKEFGHKPVPSHA